MFPTLPVLPILWLNLPIYIHNIANKTLKTIHVLDKLLFSGHIVVDYVGHLAKIQSSCSTIGSDQNCVSPVNKFLSRFMTLTLCSLSGKKDPN